VVKTPEGRHLIEFVELGSERGITK
jgi:hypothetical protein